MKKKSIVILFSTFIVAFCAVFVLMLNNNQVTRTTQLPKHDGTKIENETNKDTPAEVISAQIEAINQQEIARQATQQKIEGIITTSTDSTSVYTNTKIGLSFSYPSQYNIKEERELEGFDTGKIFTISVVDEKHNHLFRAQASSPDYAVGVGEGCCFFFNGTLEMSKSITELKIDVDHQLEKVYVPKKIKVGGIDSLEFFYTWSYVTTFVEAGVITPINNPIYSNIFFKSDALFRDDFSLLDDPQGVTKRIDKIFDTEPYAGIDQTKLQNFQEILKTVTFLK